MNDRTFDSKRTGDRGEQLLAYGLGGADTAGGGGVEPAEAATEEADAPTLTAGADTPIEALAAGAAGCGTGVAGLTGFGVTVTGWDGTIFLASAGGAATGAGGAA